MYVDKINLNSFQYTLPSVHTKPHPTSEHYVKKKLIQNCFLPNLGKHKLNIASDQTDIIYKRPQPESSS